MRVTLTDRLVASAKTAGGEQIEYFDTKAKGLALRVSPAGAKAWSLHFTGTNKRRGRLTLGSYPAMPLAAARAAALEARTLVDAGVDPRDHKSGAVTVAVLVESWMTKHVRPHRRGGQVERRMRKNVLPMIGSVRLADLHRRDINRVVDAIVARDAAVEANCVFGDIRAMLNWAVRRGDLDHNPIAGMAAPSPVHNRDRALSGSEICKLWNALPTALAKSIDCQRIIRLCLISGQRVGEVAGMTRNELDLTAREWRLRGKRTKNKHPHVVPLSDMALSVIKDALADSDGSPRLFALPPNDAARLVKQAQAAIGIAQFTPHDLRRSALTGMAALGVEPIVLGHVANHRGTTKAGVTLGVYVKYSYEAEKRHALELWAARLHAIVSGTPVAKVIPLGGGR